VSRRRFQLLLIALAGALALRLILGSGAARLAAAERGGPQAPSAAGAAEVAGNSPREAASSAQLAMRAPTPQVVPDASQDPLRWPVRPSNEDEAVVDLFATPAPAPPVPEKPPQPVVVPVVAPIEPPAPRAPPFPYTVIGDWTGDQGTAVFLAGPNNTKMARLHDLIDGVYRVESVVPGKMVVLYVPMNQSQELTWNAQH
jgi:hypothetical protein